MSRAWVEIDLDALRRNADALRTRARVPLVPMVKADAYGLGMLPVVRALGGAFDDRPSPKSSEPLAWGFGVATLEEANGLRTAHCTSRILCTSPLMLADLRQAKALDVRPALHRADDIAAWAALEGGPWHLSIDTGMSRAGVRWDAVDGIHDVVRSYPPEGVFTHFHSAERDDGSRGLQETRFADALRMLGRTLRDDMLIHADNSAAIAGRAAGSPGHLARPGIGLYGSSIVERLPVEQVVHLRARIVDVREVREGESVSYGASWTAAEVRRIATASIGYADGYRRALSNRGEALVHGVRVPVAGMVTMDMTMLDVTALGDRCQVGDVATFIGEDGGQQLHTDEVAARADLSPYELLTGLRLRIPRLYKFSTPDELTTSMTSHE
jgi:alanine racemase